MASSLSTKAQGRAADVRDAIEGLLADRNRNPHKAFNRSVSALQGEAAKVRDHRPAAESALIDAALAGSLAATAAGLHLHKPRKKAHLIEAFRSAYSPDEAAICEFIAERTGLDTVSVAAVLSAYREF